MTTAPRRAKQTWHATIHKTMIKDPDIFCLGDEVSADMMFGLMNTDLKRIGPNCEALFKLVGTTTDSKNDSKSSSKVTSDSKTRGTKRKTAGDGPVTDQRRAKKGELSLSAKITPCGYPLEHPYNKDGYRYILAEPDPHAPNWEAFDQSMEWAGKPIPGYLYRTWLGDTVQLALHDRAPQLRVNDDRLTVTGEKGYSMIRATHGVTRGNWYFEVSIREMPPDSAVRLGWSQSLGTLQAPCGYDKFSYSWRSKKGTRFHQSRGKHYSAKGFGEKDVLGFFISLPTRRDGSGKIILPQVYKDKPLVKFKSHLYYEEKDMVSETEKALKPSRGSKMIMYRNGRNQGVAFENIYEGTYFPAVSIYKNATVTTNFGPRFRHQPRDQEDWRPFCQATDEAFVEHAVGDLLFHIDNEGKLPEF